jgi:hypothetical protein
LNIKVALSARHPPGAGVPQYFEHAACAFAVWAIGPRAGQLPVLVTMLSASLHPACDLTKGARALRLMSNPLRIAAFGVSLTRNSSLCSECHHLENLECKVMPKIACAVDPIRPAAVRAASAAVLTLRPLIVRIEP